jgi:hypothetical protein
MLTTFARQLPFARTRSRVTGGFTLLEGVPMSGVTTGARPVGADARERSHPRTPAQWYCLVFGAVLLLVGILGFVVDATFDTGGALDGDSLIGFEVNGWHNLVHIASGIFLLAVSPRRASARAGAIGFGVVYGIVAIIGLVDGNDVLGLIPVNPADNVLHIAIAALGIVSGLVSQGTYETGGDRGVVGTGGRQAGAAAR